MKNITRATLLASALFTSGVGFAATQGTIGATSEGTIDIEVDVQDLVRISGLSDILLGFDATVAGDVVGSSTACIYRNGAGTYSVEATGDGAADAFILANGVNTLPYSVSWDDEVSGANAAGVTSGTVLTAQSGANTQADDCSVGGGANAFVEITVDRNDVVAAPIGTYTGTLTLLVTPE